jgi:hypothetical protein
MRALALLLAAGSAFFVFYTIRLLVVTRFLQSIRPGGGGAYLGAVVFPVLAIGLGLVARACWRRSAPPHST